MVRQCWIGNFGASGAKLCAQPDGLGDETKGFRSFLCWEKPAGTAVVGQVVHEESGFLGRVSTSVGS